MKPLRTSIILMTYGWCHCNSKEIPHKVALQEETKKEEKKKPLEDYNKKLRNRYGEKVDLSG